MVVRESFESRSGIVCESFGIILSPLPAAKAEDQSTMTTLRQFWSDVSTAKARATATTCHSGQISTWIMESFKTLAG